MPSLYWDCVICHIYYIFLDYRFRISHYRVKRNTAERIRCSRYQRWLVGRAAGSGSRCPAGFSGFRSVGAGCRSVRSDGTSSKRHGTAERRRRS